MNFELLYYSALDSAVLNTGKCCVSAVLVHATFDHYNLDNRVFTCFGSPIQWRVPTHSSRPTSTPTSTPWQEPRLHSIPEAAISDCKIDAKQAVVIPITVHDLPETNRMLANV